MIRRAVSGIAEISFPRARNNAPAEFILWFNFKKLQPQQLS